jgi:hypothetical protein
MAIAENLMADQRIIVRALILEQAIRMVIHDLRIPKRLRTALSVYQDQQGDLDSCETDWVPRGPAENARLLKTIRPSLAEVCQTYNIQSEPMSTVIFGPASPRRWSGKSRFAFGTTMSCSIGPSIDGQRHEHVTSEVMEALVECARSIGGVVHTA